MTNKEELEALKKRVAELENKQPLVVYIPQPYPVYLQPQPYWYYQQPYFQTTAVLSNTTAQNQINFQGNNG